MTFNQQTKANKSNLSYLTNYIKKYKKYLIFALLSLVITSTSILVFIKLTGFVIDRGLTSGNKAILNQTLIIMLLFVVIIAIATFSRYYFITILGENAVNDLRLDIYNKLIIMDKSFFEQNKSGELISRIISDTSLIQTVIGSGLSIFLRNLILLTGGLIMLITTSPKLALIVIMVIPVIVIPIVFFGKKVRKYSKIAQQEIANLSAKIEETIFGIQIIQSYSSEVSKKQEFFDNSSRAISVIRVRTMARALLTMIVIIAGFSAIAAIFWIGSLDVIDGKMTAGELSSFLLYALVTAGSLGAITEIISDINKLFGATERLVELSKLEPIITNIKNPIKIIDVKNNFESNKINNPIIKFDDVDFSYPSNPQKASISNINLEIKQKEKIAFVGYSGSGKTTMIELLMRFYDINKGKILLYNNDIRNFDVRELRSCFAFVPQETVIFSDSLYNNVKIANPNLTKDQLSQIISSEKMFDFVSGLPDGIDTHLGEKGVKISAGEKQRISMLRAICKNAPILIFDEPTSNLDSHNEHYLSNYIANLKDKTIITIAHRLSTINDADKIIVFNYGRIEEIGSHQELIDKKGLYYFLANIQSNAGK